MIKKDFKQKYFLYCKDCKTEKLVKILGNIKIEKLTAKQYLLFQDEMNKLGLSTVYKNQLYFYI